LTSDQIKEAQQAGLVTAESAAIFDSVVNNVKLVTPQTTPLGEPNYFLKLLDSSMDSKSKTIKVLHDATEAYGKGKLGSQQYAYFVNEANKRFKRETKGESWWDKSMEIFNIAAHGLDDFAKMVVSSKNPVEFSVKMTNKLLEKVSKGQDPVLAGQEVQRETVLEMHPQAVTYPPEGRSIIDKDGNIKIILPDGTLQDMQPKKESTK
jgi:hypothetical protein